MRSDLDELLRMMSPMLNPGVYVYVMVSSDVDAASLEPLATFREREGLTLIVEERRALDAGLGVLFRAAWITLSVHSELQAVGLTAAVATALTQADISCNVMAAACHDHIFVPLEAGQKALDALRALQASALAADG